MKYLKYFKESNEFTGFDVKYINLIQSFKRAGAFPKSTEYSNLNRLLTEYTKKVKYLPNGVWEVDSDIYIYNAVTSLRSIVQSLNFKKGNLVYFNNGLIKYSTNNGVHWYHAMSGLLDFSKLKRDEVINYYYTFYQRLKPIEDHKIFNNIKSNYKEHRDGEVMYKILCDMYGIENVDSASTMNNMGFDD